MRLFLRLQTQWRTSVVAGGARAYLLRTGIDYAALPAVASALGIAPDADMLDRLGVLEEETIRIETARHKASARGL